MKRDNEKFLEEIHISKSALDKFWNEAFGYLKEAAGFGNELGVIQKDERIVVIRGDRQESPTIKLISVVGYHLVPQSNGGTSLTQECGVGVRLPYSVNETFSLYGATSKWVEEVTNIIVEARRKLI